MANGSREASLLKGGTVQLRGDPPNGTKHMTAWGIHRLGDMIGSKDTQAGLPDGRWVDRKSVV